MKKREIESISEYSDIRFHKYRGIEFFTARLFEHIVLEPVHEEVLKALREESISKEILWSDSAHCWARDMTLEEERSALVNRTKEDIDWLLSQGPLRELNKEYREKKKLLKEERAFLLSLGESH